MLTTIDVGELATLDHVSAVSRVGAALYKGRGRGAFLLSNHDLPLSLLASTVRRPNDAHDRQPWRRAGDFRRKTPTRMELWEEAIHKLCLRLLPCLSVAAGQDPLEMAREYVTALGRLELISCNSGGNNPIILPTQCLFSLTVVVPNQDVDMALDRECETYALMKSNMLIFNFGRSVQELLKGANQAQYRLSAHFRNKEASFDALLYSFGCRAQVLPFSQRLPN